MKKSLIIAVVVYIVAVCLAILSTFTFALMDDYSGCTTMTTGVRFVVLKKIDLNSNLTGKHVFYWWDSHRLVHAYTVGRSLAEDVVKNENQTHFAVQRGVMEPHLKWMPKSVLAGECIIWSVMMRDLPHVIAVCSAVVMILLTIVFFKVAKISITIRLKEEDE